MLHAGEFAEAIEIAKRDALRPLARSVRLALPLLDRRRRFDDLAATLWSRLAFDPSPLWRTPSPPTGRPSAR